MWERMASILTLVAVLAAPASMALAAPPRGEDTANVSLERGERVYRVACAACHGRSGRGDGVAARYLEPRPRDLTSGRFRFRSSSSRGPTDADLYEIVTRGIPRTSMPGWEDLLSERERRDVVAYVKTFSDVFASPGRPLVIPADPGATVESVAEGKNVYMLMQCFQCHGYRGRGDGPGAKSLRNAAGESIKPFDFTIGDYKWGKDGRSIFRTFEAGLDGTPMPSYAQAFLYGSEAAGSVSRLRQAYSGAEVASLESYLESQRPAAELSDLPEEEREKIVSQRKWALVHYVTSLSRTSGLLRWLFVEDTEVTQESTPAGRR